MDTMKKRVNTVLQKISDAAEQAGRKTDEITLVAVSKTRTYEEVIEAFNCGLTIFGENRVQEAKNKFENINKPVHLHIIGPLQSNKIGTAVEIAECIESVDRLKVLKLIEKHASKLKKKIEVFLEFNTSGETSKHGFDHYDEIFECMEIMDNYHWVKFRGLMTIGPLTKDIVKIRKSFSELRELRDQLKKDFPAYDVVELSMGMSNDYEIAIEEGADLIRIGSALFGERVYT
ncbi:MAG: YggS family pyridoxal phosphate-dependent enzyme [Spirochaetia bacterium]|nr:YggS family pyridoxal phosphate-dependent enzyme [Spirochaetia bacterium]